MNTYHCLIELKPEARALSFAHAVGLWLNHLASLNLVSDWRLMRRKFGLASGRHTDFVLEIEIEGMAALDAAFTALADADDHAVQLYEKMHAMIESAEIGLYRPYPDPSQRERIALI
ncbi:hypothetical protein G5V65_05990 [Rhodobacter sp. HX-7-19]|uniref:Uncharacterized protein n=1 Tax=Paragemmobacter kunshanensis TaxID=2583234 RepID=A0A6M1TRD8_9RHOB|nr:DUF6614 family protein [Rhodobacter kunshanensis]NGQ90440.1 hypothetical protein [Rhodobacter kunshanensis]